MLNKAVFLDRDGVLNSALIKEGKPYPPASLAELHIPEDVPAALEALRKANFLLLVVTNQPDVARGKTPQQTVEAINNKLKQTLSLDDIYVCYHDDDDSCACRKPLPGLLIEAASQYNVDLSSSIMIGDRWKDIEAGQRAGCKTVWLNNQYKETQPQAPTFIANSLMQAATWIVNV